MRRAMGNGLLRAGSESPDQPAQMRRLIRPFAARLQNNGILKTLLPNIKASDQTGWMCNVNWVFTVGMPWTFENAFSRIAARTGVKYNEAAHNKST